MKNFQDNTVRIFRDYCSSLISATVVKHCNRKCLREKRVYSFYTSRLYTTIEKVRAGTWKGSRNHGKALLPGWLPSRYSVCFLIHSRTTDRAIIVKRSMGWDLTINRQSRHSLTYMATSQSDLGSSSAEVTSSQVTRGCAKLTIITNQYNY